MTSIATETLYTRLRSRIVEHLELIASANEQLACQQAVPIAHVSNELFNTWGDWVSSEAAIDELAAPIFSREEQQAVREFNAKLNAVAGQMRSKSLCPIASALKFRRLHVHTNPVVRSNYSFQRTRYARR